MKGTELFPGEIKSADEFVRARYVGKNVAYSDDTQVSIRYGNLVRLVAWYAAIRSEAVAEGAKPREPGETFIVERIAQSTDRSEPNAQ